MLAYDQVVDIIKKYNFSRQDIIYILHDIQNLDSKNHINEYYAEIIGKEMGIKLSELYDMITFYSMFNNEPKGKHIIEVCNSGPCFIRKGKQIVKYLEDALSIKVGETTEDGIFTLQYTSCIGACDVAPAMKIGENVYGNLTKEKVEKIIEEYRGGEAWKN